MVKSANTNDTFDIRIDNDVDLYKMNAPKGTMFKVTGVMSQFDNKSPFLQGYQLLPRDINDIYAYTNDPTVSLIPTLWVIAMGMIFELIADLRRWNSDRKGNS